MSFRLTRDDEAKALYVYLSEEPVHHTEFLSDLVMVDVDVEGRPVGVEVLL